MNKFNEALISCFGRKRFEKIQSVNVGIAGLGGLGSNAAMALVRSGFRCFVLCDLDLVEISNLNRQWYFMDQVGQPKTEALKANLLRINPELDLTLIRERVTHLNAAHIFVRCDAIIEAFDKVDSKKMLMRVFWDSDKFYVTASGIAGWGDADLLLTRKLKENIALVGDNSSEISSDLPPCAPRVLAAAAKQANALLSWVLR